MKFPMLYVTRLAKRDSFTLIETLVVVAITSLLAGMVLTYSSTGRSQIALYVESAKLAQVALRAKSLAVSTYNNPDTPCAYGMHIDYVNRSYALFSYNPAKCSDINGPFDSTPADSGGPYRELESFKLQNEINFGDAPGASLMEDVLFVPPDPTTYIWLQGYTGARPSTDVTGQAIIKAVQNPATTLKISISPAGQISF